jgi:hypothetical protein
VTDQDLIHEQETQELPLSARHRWWLARVGTREDGSRHDFYEQVAGESACDWRTDKRDRVDTDYLMPGIWDRKRLALEEAWAQRQTYEQVMLQAAAKSLRSGKIVTAEFARFSMSVIIRADRGEQCVAFIAENVFDPTTLAVMLDAFPGIGASDWAPEPGGAFGMEPAAGQVIYSALLPTDVADQILDSVPWTEEG